MFGKSSCASCSLSLQTNVDVVDNMPPAKRMKTVIVHEEELPSDSESEATTALPTTTRRRSISLDLPARCLDNNAWHGVFLPTIAHAAGGEDVDPWFIDEHSLLTILVKAWRVVYEGKLSLKRCIDAVCPAVCLTNTDGRLLIILSYSPSKRCIGGAVDLDVLPSL